MKPQLIFLSALAVTLLLASGARADEAAPPELPCREGEGDPRCGEVAPLPPPLAPPRGSTAATRTFEFDLGGLFGFRHFRSLRGFDDALRAKGYDAFPQTLPSAGGYLGLTLGRWRFRLVADDAWMSAASHTGPQGAVHANLGEARIDAGYDFLRWRNLSGFALLGIGGATFSMDALAPPNWNYLGAQSAVLKNPSTIQRDAGLLTLQVGFEDFFPLARVDSGTLALFVSIQGGYAQQVGLGPWFASGAPHANVPGTADVDFSGTFVALGAGVVWFYGGYR
jgi:hypothetical protein